MSNQKARFLYFFLILGFSKTVEKTYSLVILCGIKSCLAITSISALTRHCFPSLLPETIYLIKKSGNNRERPVARLIAGNKNLPEALYYEKNYNRTNQVLGLYSIQKT